MYLSFRQPKEKPKKGKPRYGKILYEETHKLPIDVANEPLYILSEIRKHAPAFWTHFSRNSNFQYFLDNSLDKSEGLPLSVVWALDHEELAKQLNWAPKTIQRKAATLELMLAQGWGSVPIGKLNAAFCGDAFLKQFSPNEHRAAVALLKQLAQHEFGHKRLLALPWPKRSSVRRPGAPKKSGTLVNQHIRPDNLVREVVHRIVDEMVELLSHSKEWKYALALLLCLTMGLPLQEICFIQMDAVLCDRNNIPLSIHIKGAIQKKRKRGNAEVYPKTSPKNRLLPVPTKVAYAMKPLLDEWKKKDSEQTYSKRYLIPHDKHQQRRTDFKALERWINTRFRKPLQDNRMHDGQGNVIHPRTPYRRCLSTPRQSLLHAGFETDEFRYFFGLTPSSTAGEFYCDFVNDAEQQRMRNMMDQWLGTVLPSELCDDLDLQNPSAGTTAVFGEKGQIAHVVFTLYIPPVPEEYIPGEGYQLQFWARLGFSLDVKSRPLSA